VKQDLADTNTICVRTTYQIPTNGNHPHKH